MKDKNYNNNSVKYIVLKYRLYMLVICAFIIMGCGKSDHFGDTQEYYEGDDSYIVDLSDYIDFDSRGVGFGGYNDSAESAYIKATEEEMVFTNSGMDELWLQLNNNSSDEIFITEAYVKVLSYKPIEHDEYVIERVGDGDMFDTLLYLYSEVDTLAEKYLAYPGTVNADGNFENNKRDPVMREVVPSQDGKKIIFNIAFLNTGIYEYSVNIIYEYNNIQHSLSKYCGKTLYDNIDEETIERLIDEFDEYYLD